MANFFESATEGKQGGSSGLMPVRDYFQIFANGDSDPKYLFDVRIDPFDRRPVRFPDIQHI